MGVISLDLQQTDAGANRWSYNWLTDLPSINGVTIQGDLTLEDLDIIIPTKVSELENDAGYITEEDLTDRFYTKDEVYNKDEIDDKFDDIVIPTKVSELENDAGYITDAALTPYYTSAQVDSLVEAEAAQRLNADTALANRLTTAEGKIATNETDIANNAANIAANTAGIATNAANIATNTANIATNTADIATNASNIAINTTNIAANTTDIAANTTAISNEATARQNADSGLSDRITANTTAISTNTANIATNTADIATNTSAISTNTANIATNTANIATNTSAIAANTADISTNASNIATNTANIATNAANIATNASDIAGETDAREIADQNLQEQIDAIAASSDVVDIVGTYAALQAYDTTKLHDNDIIKVLDDETRNDATAYYRWAVSTSTWSYIGAEGPFYTKADADATFVPQTRTINSKALSSNITLTAQDVGALPDSTVIPTVNNATLTIQKNGTTVQTFTANSSSNKTANITVPTKTSDLTNDGDGTSDFATETYVDTYGGKIDVIKVNGTTQTITNKTVDLTVPTKTSDLTNDSNFAVDANYVHTDNNFTTTLKNKLDGIASGAEVNQNAFSNVKVGSTTVSADSKTDTLELVAGSNVTITPNATNDKVTIAATDTKYNDMTGATSSAAGSHGLVPAPAAGDNTKFLSGDGTWKTVSQYELPIASANTLGGVKIGENLSITSTGILSADAQQIDVDPALSTTSENPVQNKVITTELNKKANSSSLATVATSGSYNDLSNKPTIDSALSTSSTNAVQNKAVTTALNSKADISSLATVATSGSYNDLSNKPTIPTVNNATLTIQKNGTTVQTFTANSSSNKTANITVPTKTSDLTNNSNFVASGDLATVATSGSYNDLSNKPTIPAAQVQSDWTQTTTTAVDYIKNKPTLAKVATSGSYNDLNNKPTIPTVNNATLTIQKNGSTVKTFTANASSNVTANITVPTATSELTNDAGFIDEIPVASAGTLGGIKVGSNLSINSSGVLSASTSGSITKASGGTLGTTTINSTTANYMEVTKLSTATDLNTIKTTGIYIIAAAPTNSPTGAWGTMYVDWTAGIKYQVYINDGVSGNIFKRSWDSSNSTWTSWIRITSADIANIERFYRSLVPVGTAITAEGTDLNTITYLKVGKYYCSTDRTVQTFVNCPTSNAFMMEVFSPLSTTIDNESTSSWIYRVRILTTYMGKMYIQQVNSGATAGNFTYGAWQEFAYKSDIGNATLTIQKNGTNVQTFTANATSNKTANITVPTKISDLTNTSGGFITYCTCSTAAATATKTITVDSGDSNWTLRKGTVIAVRFTNTNTASNVKFNVGGSGAKSVYYNTGVNTGSSNSIFGYANRTILYVYDGTNWVWLSDSRHDGNDNTIPTAISWTAAGTAAKTASMSSYTATANRYVVINFQYANTSASAITLNINGTGAKPLYINGAASSSSNYSFAAGPYILWYDGTRYYLETSGNIPRTVHPVDVASATTPAQTITDNMVVDGTLTYAKTATGEFLKLQLSTVDIGEGASLAPNTLYGVYE